MGSAASGPLRGHGMEFPHKEEYMRWLLADVRGAHVRFQAVKAGRPDLMLSRAEVRDASRASRAMRNIIMLAFQFRETFTDYTVIREGAFLALPNEHFKVFDTKGIGTVVVLEVLSALALFCVGIQEEKLSFLFKLFCFSGDDMFEADMMILLQTVTSMLEKTGITSRVPKNKELQKLTQTMFQRADTNKDFRVSLAEFILWAKSNNNTAEILTTFQKSRNTNLDKKKSGARNAHRNRMLRKRQRRRSISSPTSSPEKAALETAAAAAAVDVARASAGGSTSPSHHAFQSAGTTTPGVMAAAKRTRAAKLRTVANRKVLGELASTTRFTMMELKALAERFTDLSDVTGAIPFAEFKSVIRTTMPCLAADDALARRVFSLMSVMEDDRVLFQDFVITLAICIRGDLEEKLSVLFEVCDSNQDGTLSLMELAGLIKRGSDGLSDVISFAEEVIGALDVNGDGEVSKEEYMDLLENDPVLFETFTELLTVTPAMSEALHALRIKHSAFNIENGRRIFATLAERRNELVAPCTFESVRKFFAEHFACADEQFPFVDRIFVAFRASVGDALLMRDIVNGLGQTLSQSRDVRAQFFFDLYDISGDGTLDVSELVHMLLCSKQHVNASAAAVLRSLRTMDTDMDGRVTMEEFRARAMRDPEVLQAVFRMFNVTPEAERALFGADTKRRKSTFGSGHLDAHEATDALFTGTGMRSLPTGVGGRYSASSAPLGGKHMHAVSPSWNASRNRRRRRKWGRMLASAGPEPGSPIRRLRKMSTTSSSGSTPSAGVHSSAATWLGDTGEWVSLPTTGNQAHSANGVDEENSFLGTRFGAKLSVNTQRSPTHRRASRLSPSRSRTTTIRPLTVAGHESSRPFRTRPKSRSQSRSRRRKKRNARPLHLVTPLGSKMRKETVSKSKRPSVSTNITTPASALQPRVRTRRKSQCRAMVGSINVLSPTRRASIGRTHESVVGLALATSPMKTTAELLASVVVSPTLGDAMPLSSPGRPHLFARPSISPQGVEPWNLNSRSDASSTEAESPVRGFSRHKS